MTTYMIWPHEDDDALRSVYEETVGEAIETNPRSNGTQYIVGSYRITDAQQAELAFAFPDVQFVADLPEGFGDD